MSSPEELRDWGVEPGYWDVTGRWRDVPEETLSAVLGALGAGRGGPPEHAPLVIVGAGAAWPDLPAGTLVLEDGATLELRAGEPPPPDLPFGYHCFQATVGGEGTMGEPRKLAVCPWRCPPPSPGRRWGWSAQLYATRSKGSWGIGDFADLARLVDWAASSGAAFVLSNPLHAPAPGPVPEPSPYSPSSRCFLSPLYIRVEEVPGANALPEVATLATKAKVLNADRLIDRSTVWALKSEALEALFAHSENAGRNPHLDTYIHRARKSARWLHDFLRPHGALWVPVAQLAGGVRRAGPRHWWPGSPPALRGVTVSATTRGCNGSATCNWRTPLEGRT